jgi:hypothetical protein
MAPILVLTTSAYIREIVDRISARHIIVLFTVLFSVLAFYRICNLPDLLILLYSGELRSLSQAGILLLLPIAVATFAATIFRPSFTWTHRLAYAAILTLMPMNIYLATKQISDYTTSLSWSNYGERGFAQTVEYLANHLRPDDKTILRKDLGYYLNMRRGLEKVKWFYPVFRGEIDEMREQFDSINRSHDISFIVLEKYSNPDMAAVLIRPFFDLDKKIGDFHIYRRKESPKAHHSNDI